MADDKKLLRRLKNLFAKVPVAGTSEVSFRHDSQLPQLDDIVTQQGCPSSSASASHPAAAVPASKQACSVAAPNRLLH